MDSETDDGFCPLCARRPADAEGMCGVCFERHVQASGDDPDWGPMVDMELELADWDAWQAEPDDREGPPDDYTPPASEGLSRRDFTRVTPSVTRRMQITQKENLE